MLNLWSDVTEGTFGMAGSEGVSASVSAEIESAVTDDPVSMVEYVGSCTEGMIAVEAALAMAEGRSVAKYLTATDESAKAELVTAMEGVLADAWDKIKDYAERAYEAIKKFLKKVWNKMKGYYNVVKAMMTKYGSVLKSKSTTGLKISWVNVNINAGFASHVTSFVNTILENGSESLNTSNKSFKESLQNILYEKGDMEAHQVEFDSKKTIAIKTADEGFDWLYQNLFKLTDNTERDIIKKINDAKKDTKKDIEDMKDVSDENKDKMNDHLNRRCRDAISVVRLAAVMGNAAATKMYQQSVSACRKAIRYQAGDKSASEESTDFSALMATIL